MAKDETALALALDLRVVICRLKIPVTAFARLQLGDCLEVTAPAGPAPVIELQANGQTFAHGRIVERDGLRYVRITRLANESGNPGEAAWRVMTPSPEVV